ncbi:hypothetical protein LCGC14_0915360 [marine sediment metagenome]|uniref:Uncharacterized protein n=1 Tax=marine sediment metagenome TaxID=412755 RepID=A0A0F9PD56_9ZZZZ
MTDYRQFLRPLSPACKYTKEELKEELIADLEVDIHCAMRDGLFDYAEQCQKDLAQLQES